MPNTELINAIDSGGGDVGGGAANDVSSVAVFLSAAESDLSLPQNHNDTTLCNTNTANKVYHSRQQQVYQDDTAHQNSTDSAVVEKAAEPMDNRQYKPASQKMDTSCAQKQRQV